MAVGRKGKLLIVVGIVVLVLVSVVVGLLATRKDVAEVAVVKVEKRKELRSNVTASGEVRPIQFINLTSEVQGRIEEIYVKEGDSVKKGQPLVKLDPTQLQSSTDAQLASLQASQTDAQVSRSQVISAQNQYSQAQQGLIASQAAVDTARQAVETAKTDVDARQIDVEAAQRELNRATELVEANVIPKQEFDQKRDAFRQAQTALNNAKSRLESSKKSVAEAQARANQQQSAVKVAERAVETANLSADSSSKRSEQQAAILRGQRTQRDKTLQSAQIDGVIADIPSKVGTFAVANLSSTPLLTIADMSSINVEVKVDETEIDKVEEGQPAKVKVDAFGDKEIVGRVKLKNPLAIGKSQTSGGLSTNINTQEAKEFKVVIELTDIPQDVREGLRPGMSATAVITTKTVENIVAVPLQAVIEKKPEASPSPTINGDLQMPSEKPKNIKGVYVLDNGKAKFVEVTTGITGESDIEVKSGLEEGAEVITGPSRILSTLKDGTQVKKQTKKEGENANKS